MIAEQPTRATATGCSPVSSAGIMNVIRTAKATARPTSAASPRIRATATTRTARRPLGARAAGPA